MRPVDDGKLFSFHELDRVTALLKRSVGCDSVFMSDILVALDDAVIAVVPVGD